MKLRAESLRDLGAALSPFNAFLFLLGLETLPLRMDRHVANARRVAGISNAPDWWSESATRACRIEPLSVLMLGSICPGAGRRVLLRSAEVAGRRVSRFIEALELWSHLANVGDAKSLVIHPASTTHSQLNDEELLGGGDCAGTIRLSVGLESAEDLLGTLEMVWSRFQISSESAIPRRAGAPTRTGSQIRVRMTAWLRLRTPRPVCHVQ